MTPRPPRLARLVLRLRPLGDRRADVEADLLELFETRAAERGVRHARRRYLVDVLSVWVRRLPSDGRGHARRPVPAGSSGLLQDVRYSLRLFRRQRGVVTGAIVGLALAIGVSTAVFSLLNGVALRPIGVADPEATVTIWRRHARGASTNWPYAEFLELRARARSAQLAAWRRYDTAIAADDGSETPIVTHLVGGGFFETFGGRAARGRVLTSRDDAAGAPIVAVVSHLFWTRHFAGDPSIVGRTVRVSGVPVPIVGVAARHFTGPIAEGGPAFWLPVTPVHAAWPAATTTPPAVEPSVRVSGVLRAGVSRQQAQTELSAIAAAIGRELTPADVPPASSAEIQSADNRPAELIRQLSAIVLGVVALILLLACVNVANLLLAGATTRGREIGLRLALGASRARVVRQLLTESVVLSAAAGASGLALAFWLVPVLFALIQAPPDTDVGPDGRVYLFVAVVTLLAGAVSGLAPARHGMRGALLRLIKAGGVQAGTSGREGWLRSVFVGTQAAASIVLVVLAALLGRALLQASQTDPGFDLNRLAGIAITPPRSYDDARTAQVLDAVAERVRTLPAVERVGLVMLMPGGGNEITTTLTRDGSPLTLHHNWASSEYFAAAGHRFIRGRPYSDDEAASGTVAVITSNLASVFWGSDDPVGDTLERVEPGLRQTRVVGVIEAATTVSLNRPPPAMIYQPLEASKLEPALIVRVRGDVAAALPTFRDAVQAVDAVVRPQVWPVRQRFDTELARARMFASLAGLAGGLALLLSVLGLAGVTAFVVGQRTREIGVRMAIGATARDVVRGVLRDGLRPVVAGLAIGLVIALLSSHLIAGVLYGVSARDPIAVASAGVVLLATATVAVIGPARRAARVDPAVVLRE